MGRKALGRRSTEIDRLDVRLGGVRGLASNGVQHSSLDSATQGRSPRQVKSVQ
jgi:hypothetical protein